LAYFCNDMGRSLAEFGFVLPDTPMTIENPTDSDESLRLLRDRAFARFSAEQATAAGEAMAKKAREQFYQPRTQTSKEILGAVGEFLQPVIGALPPTLGA
jgi:hypothetical protein